MPYMYDTCMSTTRQSNGSLLSILCHIHTWFNPFFHVYLVHSSARLMAWTEMKMVFILNLFIASVFNLPFWHQYFTCCWLTVLEFIHSRAIFCWWLVSEQIQTLPIVILHEDRYLFGETKVVFWQLSETWVWDFAPKGRQKGPRKFAPRYSAFELPPGESWRIPETFRRLWQVYFRICFTRWGSWTNLWIRCSRPWRVRLFEC